MQGGHLASIHDNNENNFIMTNCHRNLIDNAFLGMSKDSDDQFYWTDGTLLDYESWGPGGMCVLGIHYYQVTR